MCFMSVSTLASSMVLGYVSTSAAQSVLLYTVCLLRLGVVCCAVMKRSGRVGCCDFCLICDACSWRCSFMGSKCVPSCRCCVAVSVVHSCHSECGVLCDLLSVVC